MAEEEAAATEQKAAMEDIIVSAAEEEAVADSEHLAETTMAVPEGLAAVDMDSPEKAETLEATMAQAEEAVTVQAGMPDRQAESRQAEAVA